LLAWSEPLTFVSSGIFGYINYLVEKDRKYILDTLVNGKPKRMELPDSTMKIPN
jgi:hypothetical protein